MPVFFDRVSRFADDESVKLPVRGTAYSAGYDLYVAEDTIIPPIQEQLDKLICFYTKPFTLDDMADFTKQKGARPTLASTGVKVHLDQDTYLKIVARSSTPLKYWLVVANSEGIIDADYFDNPDNEGEIFVQLINLSPLPIQLKKGDKVAQGIISEYLTTDDDRVVTQRTGGFGSTN